jgi:hypothetical protein
MLRINGPLNGLLIEHFFSYAEALRLLKPALLRSKKHAGRGALSMASLNGRESKGVPAFLPQWRLPYGGAAFLSFPYGSRSGVANLLIHKGTKAQRHKGTKAQRHKGTKDGRAF